MKKLICKIVPWLLFVVIRKLTWTQSLILFVVFWVNDHMNIGEWAIANPNKAIFPLLKWDFSIGLSIDEYNAVHFYICIYVISAVKQNFVEFSSKFSTKIETECRLPWTVEVFEQRWTNMVDN